MTKLKAAVAYFSRYLKPFWKGILVVIGLTLAATYFQVLAPVYMGKSITALTKLVTGKVAASQAWVTFYQAFGLMVLYYCLNAFSICVAWMVTSRFNSLSNNQMRKGLYGKLQRLTVKYFDTHQDGKMLALFNSDLDNIFNAMNEAIFEIISQSALFIGTIWMMMSINKTMALITMTSTPLVLGLGWLIMRKAKKYLDLQQEEIASLNGYVNEQINGEQVIITNGLQRQSVAQFQKYNDRVRKTMFKGQLYSGLLFPLMNGLSILNLAIVIAAGSLLVLSGQVETAAGLGLIVMFVQYSQQYFQPLTQITAIYSLLQLAITGANRLAKVEAEVEEDRIEAGIKLTKLQDKVTLEDVHFGYQPEREILHGINIEVKKGQAVALVGPTGSGKTTVMNLLNRFYDVTSGAVKFDGIDVRQLDLTTLRKQVGIVLQDSVLFTGTIATNIKFGKPNASDQEMIAAAKKANIHDFIMSLPKGYETEITEENNLFSTGQKQLVSIARTLLSDPDFLILDEATSNVDTVTEAKLQKAMDNVIAGRTSFVIAHRLKTIINADKIVVLKAGTVIESGSHQELLAKQGFYYDLYRNQMAFE
ncbi:ABC transporter ATP-binding protein [Ligilactobacillus agilis]|uniref:ABC transporter ATP-binding protein n=1 Tax=Ligilactobacillus agilis TaxID=1601 RepID=UPI001437B60B|nr:ABC transporter ATP-binding protein [Ligilactobacillus agilis]GET10826.1 multidrug ABC transporter ATP-binding and permease protein [Ligilactobacillus agilis]